MEVATLEWQEWRSDGTAVPSLSGTVSELGSAVTLATLPSGDFKATPYRSLRRGHAAMPTVIISR